MIGDTMTKAVIVHGGAWNIPETLIKAHKEGTLAALRLGWEVLEQGGSAVMAVVKAISAMELDPTFDAGVGAFLNTDGEVELDAGLMDGQTLDIGAVAAVQRIKTPIVLAHGLLRGDHNLMVGKGALRLAQQIGVEECEMEELIVEREKQLWEEIRRKGIETKARRMFDTVGAVAFDGEGNLAAGTSSGGTPHKLPGRVGDAPLVGCGFYADNLLGGTSVAGWGEAIMKMVVAKSAVDLLAEGRHPQKAAEIIVRRLWDRVAGRGGIIMVDKHGRVGYAFNTQRMAYAYMRDDLTEAVVGMGKPYNLRCTPD
jgi:beta-aspartyl-peptidase (threonine type)